MRRPPRALLVLAVLSLLACALPLPPAGPTPTPSATLTPTPTLTPPPTPTATPTPTPLPAARVGLGSRALLNGDFDLARAQYNAALNDVDPNVRAGALYGLALTEYQDGELGAALLALRQLTTEHAAWPDLPRAFFLLGRVYESLGRYAEAADAYNNYLLFRPGLLDAYVQELRGDMLYAARDYAGARSAYQSALQAPRAGGTLEIEIKLARALAAQGDYAGAIQRYDEIAPRADYPTRARLEYLAGQAYLSLGQPDTAYQRFLYAVENYPQAYDAYLGLVELVEAGWPVSDLDRGIVDYYAGQYGVGLAALDRYLASAPVHDGTAHYFRALTLRALGYYNESVAEFDRFLVAAYAENPFWAEAWDEKIFTQWAYQQDYFGAAATALKYVADMPSSPQAPDYLMEAARNYERAGQLDLAAATWSRVADEYSGSSRVPQALFWAGLARYRMGDLTSALTTFQRDLLVSYAPEDQARAYLWIGKTQAALGQSAEARNAWQLAHTLDPTGYYSERARELLTGRPPLDPPALYTPDVDLEAERAEAEAWLRLTFSLPAETDLRGPGALVNDGRFQRGQELWALGEYDLAEAEFRSLRLDLRSNVVDSYRLANELVALGAYFEGIFAAREVLTLAGMTEQAATLRAPRYFNHLRYGLYYREVIDAAASENGLHPLLLYSVARQESLFDGNIRSSADARGLFQIIPSTGEILANRLGWPLNYTAGDLWRPQVSARFGARYLADNCKAFGGDLYVALAAYNAGPGNAAEWWALANGDPDLMVEVVRAAETRNYIRSIFEIYAIYRRLYSPVE